jgi:hypothetical protein
MLHAGQAHRRDDTPASSRVLPTSVVAVLRFSMFTATRWRSLIFWKSALVGAVGALGPAAGIGVVVEHARHALSRPALAQVFDGGDHGHGFVSLYVPLSYRESSPGSLNSALSGLKFI